MGFSISKNGGATVYTIAHFTNISIEQNNPADPIPNVTDNDEAAILLAMFGPTTKILLNWIIMQESSSVVSGTGSPVTGAPEQVKYLFDIMMPHGADQIEDEYTLTITFDGGTTFVRTGRITRLTCPMSSDSPLTFDARIEFQVGTIQ